MKPVNRGFTLVELMITVAVFAVVLSVAAPSFNSQLQNNRSLALGDEIASALSYARLEAIKQAKRVTMCASKDGLVCAGNWNEGFIIFVDSAAADDAVPNPKLGPLKTWGKSDHDATLTAKFDGSADTSYVRFTPMGSFARPASGATKAEIDVQLKGCKGTHAPRITVGMTGMVSVSRRACL